jgi:hypothetical protein
MLREDEQPRLVPACDAQVRRLEVRAGTAHLVAARRV